MAGASAVHAVVLDVVVIEHPAEPWIVGEREARHLRASVGRRSGSTRSDRGRGESTRRRCRAESNRKDGRRPAAPRGAPSSTSKDSAIAATRRHSVGPPDHEESKLQTSIAPASIRSRQPAGGELALPGADAHAATQTHVAHGAPVVGPATGLLEPAEVLVRDQPREPHGICRRPTLIGVGHQNEIRTAGLTRFAEALGVLLRREAAHLELHASQAALAYVAISLATSMPVP